MMRNSETEAILIVGACAVACLAAAIWAVGAVLDVFVAQTLALA